MRIDEIERMLDRYYDGRTTESEEMELKRFFSEEEVPAHLLTEKQLFMQLSASEEPEVPAHLESNLNRMIDEWDHQEKQMFHLKKYKRNVWIHWVGSIAACLLIFFSVGTYIFKPYTPPTPQDTCSNPEEAYVEAQKALVMLSSTLNKGLDNIETVQNTTEKVTNSVNQQLNRINSIK